MSHFNEENSLKVGLKGKKDALGSFISIVIGTQQRSRVGEEQKGPTLSRRNIWQICHGHDSLVDCLHWNTAQHLLPHCSAQDQRSSERSSIRTLSQAAHWLINKSILEEEEVKPSAVNRWALPWIDLLYDSRVYDKASCWLYAHLYCELEENMYHRSLNPPATTFVNWYLQKTPFLDAFWYQPLSLSLRNTGKDTFRTESWIDQTHFSSLSREPQIPLENKWSLFLPRVQTDRTLTRTLSRQISDPVGGG